MPRTKAVIRSSEKRGRAGHIHIGAVGSNITSYSDTGLTPGTSYCYRVRAYNGAGDSDYSNETCVATPVSTIPISGYVKEPDGSGIESVSMVYGDPEVLDQAMETSNLPYNLFTSMERDLWQEFKPTQEKLSKIDLMIEKVDEPIGYLIVTVKDFNEQALWTTWFVPSAITSGTNWLSVPIIPSIRVVPGQIYRIHLNYIDDPLYSGYFLWYGDGQSAYADGIANIHTDYYVNFDYNFRTYGGDADVVTNDQGYYEIRVFWMDRDGYPVLFGLCVHSRFASV